MDKKSRRVIRQVETRSSGRLSWYLRAVSLALIIGGIFLFSQNPEKTDTPGFKPTKEETVLLNSLFAQVNPALPENSYMPEFMKEKLSWLFSEIEAKRLDVDYDLASEWPEVREALLVSTYNNGRPTLVFIIDRLALFLKDGGKLPESVSRRQKNSFAAALVHETVHLENDLEWFRKAARDARVIPPEEFRAYVKVDQLVVTPLLNVGEPVDPTHIKIHDILVGCKYQMPCQALMDYVLIPK